MSSLTVHIIGVVVALSTGVVGAVTCVRMGCSPGGLGGGLISVMIGVTLAISDRSEPRLTYTLIAPSLAIGVLLPTDYFMVNCHQTEIRRAIQADESYIVALAERIVLERMGSREADPRLREVRAVARGATFTSSLAQLPDDLRREATARWNAMSDQKRQAIRERREHMMEVAHGPELERRGSEMSFFRKPISCAISGTTAWLVAMFPMAWNSIRRDACAARM